MNKFIKTLKKLFIGEREPLPTIPNYPLPLSIELIKEQINEPKKQLSCFAQGIIKSLESDDSSWQAKGRGYYHTETKIYIKEYYCGGEMGGTGLVLEPEYIYNQLSDDDRDMILQAMNFKQHRQWVVEYEKTKELEKIQAKPITDYFSKLGCP